MKWSVFSLILLVATASGFAACGGSTNNTAPPAADAGDDSMGDDAGTGDDATPDADMPDAAPPLDHGKVSTTYPAVMPTGIPTLTDNGGTVLASPVIVTVTWQTDPLADQLEAFGDAIGPSNYWKAMGVGYGVGPATSGAANHMRIPVTAGSPLPTTLSQGSMPGVVQAGIATGGWPAPTAQTIYMIFIHPMTQFTARGGDACLVLGGYHTSTQVNGQDVAFAVVPRCRGGGNLLDTATDSASHELGEAATDPHPQSLPAYIGFDQSHLAWWLFNDFQMENGDACEFYQDSFYREVAPFAYHVQRMWNDQSAQAGHAPCVPPRPGPYFNVSPTTLETVTADISAAGMGPTLVQTKGFRIKQGETKQFPVALYSDGPTNGAWSLRVAEAFSPAFIGPASHHLALSIDMTSGQNGQIAYVSVTVNTAGQTISTPAGATAFPKLNFITVLSSLGNSTSYMPILIVN